MRRTTVFRVATLLGATAVQTCQQENITSVIVRSVIVEPAQASIVAGDGLAFTAAIVDEHDVLLEGADVTWSSEDARIVTIGEDGRAEARSAGTTRIVAAYEGVTGSASVVVQAPGCVPEEAPGKGKKGKGDDDDDDGHDDDDDDDDGHGGKGKDGKGKGDKDDKDEDKGDKDDEGDKDDNGDDDQNDEQDDDPDDDEEPKDEEDEEGEEEPDCTPAAEATSSLVATSHASMTARVLPPRGGR